MQVQSTIADGFIIVTVQGRVDTITAGDFEAKVKVLTENEITKMIIDCTELEYISSSGLRVFLIIQKKINARGGMLRLCCMQPAIKEIFDISGFSNIFKIFTDLASASA